jgi:hypothetical protein
MLKSQKATLHGIAEETIVDQFPIMRLSRT